MKIFKVKLNDGDISFVRRNEELLKRGNSNSKGYWMLRDEHAAEWTRGLDVILQVGETSDMVPAPEDFPKCGSFVGPEYFLI